MLKFKEYLKQEGFNPINFVGGFATNLAGQSVKGLGNITKGAGKTAAGLAGTAGGLVSGASHGILGSKDNAKKSTELAKKSIGLAGGGLNDIVKGVIQLGGAASLITPFLRGIQASAEPMTPSRFNRNRTHSQKLFGFNSEKESPFIINGAPKDSGELRKLINTWYEEAINKREVQVKGRPENFIKSLVTLYNSTETDNRLNKKIKYLLSTYFSNFEVLAIEVGSLLKAVDEQVLFSNSKIIKYIEFLHKKSKNPNIVLITQNNKLFLDELIKIHNEYLSSKNLILGKKDKETEQFIKETKNKIIEIIARFAPNKKITTTKRN